ncbi:hypothetical protein, partial [uncultured Hyphomicrobium sp.]|uniref:hypothetical protein n=1 Tax=uncultured Hyphomicrobium sp. TaxID=194373 RepID=UPI0025F39E31
LRGFVPKSGFQQPYDNARIARVRLLSLCRLGALDLLGSDAPEAFLNRFVEFETKGHFEARARG